MGTIASALAIFAVCPSAYATERQDESRFGPTLIHKNEPAPFMGDLWPIGDSIRIALEVEGCDSRQEEALHYQGKLHQVEISRLEKLAQVTTVADAQRISLLQSELEAASVWYRSPVFVATISATVAVGCLLASAYLIQSTVEAAR